MPVVTLQRPDLCRLMGHDEPMDRLVERMPMIGGDIDRVDGEAITIEWFPDRPDLLTPEGSARALAAFLGHRPGLRTYDVAKAKTRLTVDASVAAVRPHAALCIVRGVPFDAAYVASVMDAQEKLTLAPGRKRRKIAIGIHDAATVKGPFTYTCIGPDDKPFRPLAWDEDLSPAQIMEKHPKGREYGHLLPDGRYPVFLDADGEVLSLPPVINAARTTVTADTKDLLIDVTGTDARSVRHTIALLAAGFADRGGAIEAVTVDDASGTWTSPDFKVTERVLEVDPVNRWLGTDLDADAMAACLERMGHGAQGFGTKVLVESPAWRFDLLHDVDWMEDIAIGHGFENFEGMLPGQITYGGDLDHQVLEDRLRVLMVGHGFLEARTLTLSHPDAQWTKWGEDPAAHEPVRVRNPVLEDRVILRTRLVPSLLEVLAANRHRSLPHRLFEIGHVVDPDATGLQNRLHLAAVESAAKTGFSDVKGLVEAVVRDAGLEAALQAADAPGFIPGRGGDLRMARAAGGKAATPGPIVGHFGELHPDTLVAFGLGAATTALEIDLTALLDAAAASGAQAAAGGKKRQRAGKPGTPTKATARKKR